MDERALQQRERRALCDTLDAVGPDAPTMCEGWDAHDLAAHLVVRERDPWTAPVIICGVLNGVIHRMTLGEKARGFGQVVGRLRNGPPWLFRATPAIARLNAVEDWIHHEDVRRAQPGWERRAMGPEMDDVLWRGVGAAGKVAAARLHGVALELVAPGDRRRTLGGDRNVVEVHGEPGEILRYVTGRTTSADVDLRGTDADLDLVRRSGLRL